MSRISGNISVLITDNQRTEKHSICKNHAIKTNTALNIAANSNGICKREVNQLTNTIKHHKNAHALLRQFIIIDCTQNVNSTLDNFNEINIQKNLMILAPQTNRGREILRQNN